MRRLTVALLVVGCLALVGAWLAPTAGSPISATVSAQSPLHPCLVKCGNSGPEDHYLYCHVDNGGEGHLNCSDSSSIQKHLDNHNSPEQDDQCIGDGTGDTITADDCEKKGA